MGTADSSIESVYVYSVKIFFMEQEEPFTFRLDVVEAMRFLKMIVNFKKGQKEGAFPIIQTFDGKIVNINLLEIQFANAVFDFTNTGSIAGEVSNGYEDGIMDDIRYYEMMKIRFLLKGHSNSFEIIAEYPEQLYHIQTELELFEFLDELFVSFEDEDGYEIILNTTALLYIEVPEEIFDEGREIFHRETNDGHPEAE